MDEDKKPANGLSDKQTRVIVVLVIALVVIVLFMLIRGVMSASKSFESTRQEQAQQEAEPEPEPTPEEESNSELDLEVRQTVLGLQITNNEPETLENCLIEINPGVVSSGYTTRDDILKGNENAYPWSSFTKGGERFDPDRLAAETVKISQCANAEFRSALFGS